MMDSPFFRSHWNFPSAPRYSPNVRGIPVQRQTMSVPKVVPIPVHFVGSERSRSDSALKIQKVFRGFLVRKSVKKIAAIKSEVDGIEKRISKKETVELIRRDSKERLKVNETLMSLLFRLDSVRGVDFGVRTCRKAVIKKAIALQEMVDAIIADGNQTVGGIDVASEADNVHVAAEAVDQTGEVKEFVQCCSNDGEKALDQAIEMRGNAPEVEYSATNFADNCNPCENAVVQTLELQYRDEAEAMEGVKSLPNSSESDTIAEVVDGTPKLLVPDNSVDENQGNEDKDIVENLNVMPSFSECAAEESVETSQTESQSDSSANPQSLVEGDGGEIAVKPEDGMETLHSDQKDQKEGNVKEKSRLRGRDENKQNRVLERMMEDNEKMMGLMAELFERNEMQTQLLSSLSQRVEQLERAFICDRLRRKKKRDAAGAANGFETLADMKKCGKR